jgi:O-acetyl-ADP-ribose deacetylase (regulator of RNase III)
MIRIGPRGGEAGESEARTRPAAAFSCARERGWSSVSFPAVSAGIFAVPPHICARAYLAAVRGAAVSKVRLCLRDQAVIDAVLEEASR